MYKYSEITEEGKAPVSTGLLARMQEDILTGEMKPGEKIMAGDVIARLGGDEFILVLNDQTGQEVI